MIFKLIAAVWALTAIVLWTIGDITGSTPLFWLVGALLLSWLFYLLGATQDSINAQNKPQNPAYVNWEQVQISRENDGSWVFNGTITGPQAYKLAQDAHVFGGSRYEGK